MTTSVTPSTDARLVAVVGATGNQGGSVVDALLGHGVRVRALVRDLGAPAAHRLADRGVELTVGDLTDAASLDTLFDRVDAAFAMTTPIPGGTEQETAAGIAVADAAARAQVPHLVFSSVGGAERKSGVPHFESKRRVEEHIESLDIHHTFLRPVFFMENLAGFSTSVEEGQVVVRMAMPGEAVIRTGALAQMFPSTFPSGQGSDLAGVIEEVGAGVSGFSPGDEVIGFSNKRSSQAELVLVEAGDLTRKPENVPWEVAGALYVVGVTAWGAAQSVQFKKGETVVVSGAAGGVGSLAVQLARRTGAGLLADGHLELPIANVYPLTQVREAYAELERRHTHGKIVLRP